MVSAIDPFPAFAAGGATTFKYEEDIQETPTFVFPILQIRPGSFGKKEPSNVMLDPPRILMLDGATLINSNRGV